MVFKTIRFWSIETKCDYHIHIKCIAQYARIDFICSLYDCELLYFSERLKEINWRKLVLYYMYHTRALCTYYVVMMHCILIIHVSKIAKQNMSSQGYVYDLHLVRINKILEFKLLEYFSRHQRTHSTSKTNNKRNKISLKLK